jgi:acyl-CoA thioester hydrolase
VKGFAVTLEIPLLWADMDSLRHVNNARYFTWYETARIAYFDRLRGLFPGAGSEPAGLGEVGPILASTSCDYLRPIVFPGRVTVGARVSEIGNSSLRLEYAVARSDALADVCARATSVVVLVRYATMEKVRVPDEVRAAISQIEKGAGVA